MSSHLYGKSIRTTSNKAVRAEGRVLAPSNYVQTISQLKKRRHQGLLKDSAKTEHAKQSNPTERESHKQNICISMSKAKKKHIASRGTISE
jgi:hypothetical protein